jgi:hypothetical protein
MIHQTAIKELTKSSLSLRTATISLLTAKEKLMDLVTIGGSENGKIRTQPKGLIFCR